jgi:hypothetical protein
VDSLTINDLQLNEECIKLRALAEKIPYYMREGRVADLESTIGQINEAAVKAGYRLNDLRYTKGR